MQVVSDVECQKILTARYGNTALVLGLYCVNVAITDATVLADLTEASGGGYSRINLAAGAATIGDDGAGIRQAAWTQQTFTFTGQLTTNTTVYGYFILDGTDIVKTETLSTSFTPDAQGGTLNITPKIKASKGAVS